MRYIVACTLYTYTGGNGAESGGSEQVSMHELKAWEKAMDGRSELMVTVMVMVTAAIKLVHERI